MPSFVIFFVDVRESRRLNLPDHIPSPFGTLCRVVSGYGSPNMDPFRNFRMMWADEDNNLMPLLSDRMLIDALRRLSPRAPLHVYVKGVRPPPEFMGNGAIRSRSNSLTLRAANRPMNSNNKDRMVQEHLSRPYGPMPTKADNTRWMPAAGMNRNNFERKGKDFRVSLMPEDPTLAELVDNVRQNLEAALKSVQFCAAPVPNHEETHNESIEIPIVPVTAVPDPEDTRSPQTDTADVLKSGQNEEPKENDLLDALDEGAATPRPCSSASGEFMILTPSTDSCPIVVGEREFEAVFSEFDSEFEVVDAPDEWDSDVDVDWRSLSFSKSLNEPA
ncbi:uncharacterized protein LOC129589339 [Paramacrobiotus metropolitanus]|uniref:uncharacterized protein LOC129589339 n=1 Tax=Paramacrobiotus metropolitanus TaxID=2943436 RepID=UPI0024464DE9|nr:uncharacterized protein LOC129589339 [Paramacrobiotus metropolitanus]